MTVRQTRKNDNGDTNGHKQRDYKWQVIGSIVLFLLGGGTGTGVLQVISPTNVQVQSDIEGLQERQGLLNQDYKSYKVSHADQSNLKEINTDLKLSNIQDDITDLKKVTEEIKNILKK